jgi:hypothetical protein
MALQENVFSVRHLRKLSDKNVGLCVLSTSSTVPFSRCRINQTPSSTTVSKIHFNTLVVKSIENLPSHKFLPFCLAMVGILWVSNSLMSRKMPSSSRNPTIIRCTPNRKDCAQNFCSLRSNATSSLLLVISLDVLSST